MRRILVSIALLISCLANAQYFSIEGFSSRANNLLHPTAYPNLYYEIQIADLNRQTKLELFYDDQVQGYIDLFLSERKEDLMIFIDRSESYFPLFEKILKQYDIPLEIKYLAVLESGLSPTAISPSEAVGLWQFKKPSGENYGLIINQQKDERENPELSTIAACKYLKTLFSEFNDWNISLLAYNAGPGYIRRTINTTHEKHFYELQNYLTIPSQKYLPALVAIIYLFNNFENHF